MRPNTCIAEDVKHIGSPYDYYIITNLLNGKCYVFYDRPSRDRAWKENDTWEELSSGRTTYMRRDFV